MTELLMLKPGFVFVDPRTGISHDIMQLNSDDRRLVGQRHKFATSREVINAEGRKSELPNRLGAVDRMIRSCNYSRR